MKPAIAIWSMRILCLTAAVIGLGIAKAKAVAVYTDRSVWESAVANSLATEDFNGLVTTSDVFPSFVGGKLVLPAGQAQIEVSGPGTSTSLVRGSGSTRSGFNLDGTPFAYLESYWSGASLIYPSLVFAQPVYAFGGDWSKSWYTGPDPLYSGRATMTIAGQTWHFADYLATSPGTGFLGIVSATPFTRVDFKQELTPAGVSKGQPTGLDNLSFSTAAPAPGSTVPTVSFTSTDTPQSLGFDVPVVAGDTGQVVEVTSVGSNYVLRLYDPGAPGGGDDVAAITRTLTVTNQLFVGFDYQFVTDGKLQILVDNQVLDTIEAPASGAGRDSFDHYSSLFSVAAGSPMFELRLSNPGDPELLLDNIQVGAIPAPVPEPSGLALLAVAGGAPAALMLRVRFRGLKATLC